MINILHIFVSLPVGGAENLLLSTVKGLDAYKYRSFVCCISEKGPVGDEIEALGFPVHVLGKLKKGGFDRSIVDDLAELAQSLSIGLIHTHLYHANMYGRLAAKRAGVPVVSSIHNTYSSKPKLQRRLFNWYLARHCKAIIAGSTEIRDDIIRWDHVSADKIELIPNTVDLSVSQSELTREQARQALGITQDQIVLGTMGRLEEQKGHSVLLDAMATLCKQYPQIHLLLVGDGRLRSKLEEQASALGISSHISFLGTRRDIGDLFRAMDIFVMPSLWEGLSLAMLSAMAANLPVIATRVGGVSEVMGNDEFGLTLEPSDPEALSQKIGQLMDDKQKREYLAEIGKQHVETNYSDAALVSRLQDIYRKALA